MTKIEMTENKGVDALPAETMLGYWFKEFADLGHWFDKAHSKCIRCGTPTIDLYEDGSYGRVRSCASALAASPQTNPHKDDE